MGNPPIHGNFDGEYDDELWDFEGGSQYFQTSSLLITYIIGHIMREQWINSGMYNLTNNIYIYMYICIIYI